MKRPDKNADLLFLYRYFYVYNVVLRICNDSSDVPSIWCLGLEELAESIMIFVYLKWNIKVPVDLFPPRVSVNRTTNGLPINEATTVDANTFQVFFVNGLTSPEEVNLADDIIVTFPETIFHMSSQPLKEEGSRLHYILTGNAGVWRTI